MQSRSSALRGSSDILRHELTETAKKKTQKTKTQKTTKKQKKIKKNIPPKKPYNLPPDHYTITLSFMTKALCVD